MASSYSLTFSKSVSHIFKSRSKIDYAQICHYEKTSVIWISTMRDNSGKKFRCCHNSMGNKSYIFIIYFSYITDFSCKFYYVYEGIQEEKYDLWEWVDDDEEPITQDTTEVKILILKNNLWTHEVKADYESMSFRKALDKLSRKY